jgi:hypothetical protein
MIIYSYFKNGERVVWEDEGHCLAIQLLDWRTGIDFLLK